MKNKYSILIPVYDAEEHLYELWESIVRQSFSGPFECIFLDDGSIDGSIEILEELINSYEGKISFKIISDGENKKQGYRRNQGIQIATGELIIFLDSDDTLNTETLRICYEKYKKNKNVDVIAFNYIFMEEDSEGRLIYKNTGYANYSRAVNHRLLNEECEDLLSHHTYFTVNKAYRRKFLIENNIKYGVGYYYEDFEFYTHVAVAAKVVEVLPQILYNVRLQKNSTTKINLNDSKHMDDSFIAICKSLKHLKNSRSEFGNYNAIKYFLHRTLYYSVERSNFGKVEIIRHLEKLIKEIKTQNIDIKYPKVYISNLFYIFFKIQLFQYEKTKLMFNAYLLHLSEPKKLKEIVSEHKKNQRKYKTRIKRVVKLEQPSYYSIEKIRRLCRLPIETKKSEKYNEDFLLIDIDGFSYASKYYNYVVHLIQNKGKIDFLKGKKIQICFTPTETYNLLENPYLSEYMVSLTSEEKKAKKYNTIVTDKQVVEINLCKNIIMLNVEQPILKVGYDKWEKHVVTYNFYKETTLSQTMSTQLISGHNTSYNKLIYLENFFLNYMQKNSYEIRKNKRLELNINNSKKIILIDVVEMEFDIDMFYQNISSDDYILIVKDDIWNRHAIEFEKTITLKTEREFQDMLPAADIYVTDYSGNYYLAKECVKESFLMIKNVNRYDIYEDVIKNEKNNIIYDELDLISILEKN